MQSSEIIKKYTEKKFIQVDTFVAKEYATVEKLENLIEIDDAFLFTEDLLSEEEATDCIVDSSLDMAVDALLNNSTTFLSRTEARDLVDDVECEYGEELVKKCKIKSAHFLTIRSLKYNIEYNIDENSDVTVYNFCGSITNIKVFDIYEDQPMELLQMYPTHQHLIINDTARKIVGNPGVAIR